MAHIVILGAGLGGAVMAYEMKAELRAEDRITVITKDPKYHFVPSNPWVAVKWRERIDTEIDLAPAMRRRGIEFKPVAASQVVASENRVELVDGTSVDYDYLIIATGPELAFDEIEGLGPDGGFTQSVCHIDHAEKAYEAFEEFCKDPGPIVVGAVQGASCFGPAYEFLFILETELRRRKIRDKVPMTFITSEPYIGHLGLDGVGDTKGLLESNMRDKHIKWMTSSKMVKAENGVLHVESFADDGTSKGVTEVPAKFSMMLPAFRGIKPLFGNEGLVNPRGFVIVDKHQQNPTFKNVFSVGVCVAIPPDGRHARSGRRSQDRLHDRIHGHRHRAQYRPDPEGRGTDASGHVERRLPRRFRRQRHRLRRAAADSAAQRQLVVGRQVGASGQDRLREIFHRKDEIGQFRALLRKAGAAGARHRQAEGNQDRRIGSIPNSASEFRLQVQIILY